VSPAPRRDTISLLGLRCSGKTSVGRALAAELSRAFVDLDEEVLRTGRYAGWRAASAGELLERAGLAVFRDLEAAALRRALEPSPRTVLATGGGVVEREDNRAWLARTARCVFLSVPVATLEARLRADPSPRPALLGGDAAAELGELLARREPHYRALAELVVECGAESPAEIARRIRAGLGLG
jgi:shikimate kinase